MAIRHVVILDNKISNTVLATIEGYREAHKEAANQARILNETRKYKFIKTRNGHWKSGSNYIIIKSNNHFFGINDDNKMTALSPEERRGMYNTEDEYLTSQYFECLRKSVERSPEKLLVIAILEDALTCYARYMISHRPKRPLRELGHEAILWFLDTNKRETFSFESICDVLGMDANRIRRVLGHIKLENLELVQIREQVTKYKLVKPVRKRVKAVIRKNKNAALYQ